MIPGIRLGNVMIDCKDEQSLCSFYELLLGLRRSELFGRPALTGENGVILLFMQEEDYVPPVWPEENGRQQKQMHFDFQVPSVPEAVAYAESIGAKKAPAQFGGEVFVTMLDPEGHPFCLCYSGNEA
ncbi:MAG: VOC family protein [Clostridiaceae bacterium]